MVLSPVPPPFLVNTQDLGGEIQSPSAHALLSTWLRYSWPYSADPILYRSGKKGSMKSGGILCLDVVVLLDEIVLVAVQLRL